MKNKKKKEMELDDMDKFLYELAQKDIKPIPKEIRENIIKTIDSLDFDAEIPNKLEKEMKQEIKIPFYYRFREKINTIVSKPAPAVLASFLLVSLVATGAVGAREMSEKIFGKDTVRLTNIGISNEFTFTEEMESALIQNVPLNLVQLNDDYYISVHSILLDEINFFTVFELHSKKEITDDLSFAINDLKISDENGNVLYDSYLETNINTNKGYKPIYNTNNSIKILFFMFGNDNSKIKELNFNFSNILIHKNKPELSSNSNFDDINITCDNKNINIAITKDNYNTIQEYTFKKYNSKLQYNIEKAILTKTGFYLTAKCTLDSLYPIVEINNTKYVPIYSLPLKRVGIDSSLMLFSYNIKESNINDITIYNHFNSEDFTLFPIN